MRISLVVPDFLSGTSFLQQPLDLLYSAELLRARGHDVQVVDCRVDRVPWSQMLESLRGSDVVLVTTTPCDQVQNYFLDYRYAYAVRTANVIKQSCGGATVVVCGAHATIRPDLVMAEVHADILIVGEVMASVVLLAEALENHASLDSVPNIIYRGDGRNVATRVDAALQHPVLRDDIFPAYDMVDMSQYFGVRYVNNVPLRRRNRVVVQGGRGCPFSCAFCHKFYGSHVHRRSVESVVSELAWCQTRYGTEEAFFLDEVFTLDREWVLALCESISRQGIRLEITVQTRVDCLDDQLLVEMSSAGVRNLWLGVESASDAVLEASTKGFRVDAVLAAVESVRRANITPHAFFMLGMPGETVASLNQTLRQIHTYRLPYTRSVMICTPRYGTPYYEMALTQYPNLGRHWFNLNAVKGLVQNEMTPSILQRAKGILRQRDFVYSTRCPQL